jgi:hypothetical protein
MAVPTYSETIFMPKIFPQTFDSVVTVVCNLICIIMYVLCTYLHLRNVNDNNTYFSVK